MAVTIKDIARKAGASHSAMSRAPRDSASIAPETVWRIQRADADMGYVPSAAARSPKHWGSSPISRTPSSAKSSTVSKKSSWKPADDVFDAVHADLPLTMLVRPKYHMGRDAASLTFKLLKADRPVRPRAKSVRGQLRVRASTAPPRE